MVNRLNELMKEVQRLTAQDKKEMMERMVKLLEESGELAQEVLIANRSSGTHHKQKGDDGILGESVDVMLVALSIFFHEEGTIEDLKRLIEHKCKKWERIIT